MHTLLPSHVFVRQSPSVPHVPPRPQPGQSLPPQSTSLSAPFIFESLQSPLVGAGVVGDCVGEVVGDVVGAPMHMLFPSHVFVRQSPSVPHAPPRPQPGQTFPPQSISLSTPFILSSVQVETVGAGVVGERVGAKVGETEGANVGLVVGAPMQMLLSSSQILLSQSASSLQFKPARQP